MTIGSLISSVPIVNLSGFQSKIVQSKRMQKWQFGEEEGWRFGLVVTR